MIKANEIRIGNQVEIAGCALEILWFNLDNALVRTPDGASNSMYANLYKMQGIPLTLAILNGAGLGAGGMLTAEDREICSRPRETEPGVYAIFVEGTRIAKVRFVHELQNLFFALTGEECKIVL